MAKCENCGKEWTKEMALGTPESPISWFIFTDTTGPCDLTKEHPFDRFRIDACPDCEWGVTKDQIVNGKRTLRAVFTTEHHGHPTTISTDCTHCKTHWTVEKDAPLPVGFHFRVESGDSQDHPFERGPIVSCPSCKRTAADLMQAEPNATMLCFQDGKTTVIGKLQRVPLPFFEPEKMDRFFTDKLRIG